MKYLFILILFSSFLFTQNEANNYKLKKADELLRENKADEALQLFKEVYQSNTQDESYFQFYKNALISQKKIRDALNLMEFKLLRLPNDFENKNEIAQYYFELDNKEKAFELWQTLLKQANNVNQFAQIANALITERLFDKAIECYQTAQLKLAQPFLFSINIYQLQLIGFNYSAAFKTIMDYLSLMPTQYEYVQRQVFLLIEKPDARSVVIKEINLITEKNIQLSKFKAELFIQLDMYAEAIKIFKREEFANTNYLLSLAKSLILKDQLLAQNILKEIALESKNYAREAEFFLALSYLKTESNRKILSDSLITATDNKILPFLKNDEFGLQLYIKFAEHQLYIRNDSKQSITLLEKAEKIKSSNSWLQSIYFLKAQAYLVLNNSVESTKYFDLVNENYLSGIKFIYMSLIHLQEKDEANLNEYFSNVLQSNDRLKNKYVNDFIELLFLEKNEDLKNDELKKFATIYLSYLCKQYKKAIDLTEQFFTTNKQSVKINRLYLLCLLAKKETEKSLEFCTEQIKSEKNIDMWLFLKATIYHESNNLSLAKQEFEKLLLNFPESFYAVKTRQVLAGYIN